MTTDPPGAAFVTAIAATGGRPSAGGALEPPYRAGVAVPAATALSTSTRSSLSTRARLDSS
jgi:hypothetical protein